jgi:hypothetical protein
MGHTYIKELLFSGTTHYNAQDFYSDGKAKCGALCDEEEISNFRGGELFALGY